MADIEDRLQKSQDNVIIIKKIILGWLSRPLFERKDGRRELLLNLDELAQARKMKQYKEIQEMSDKVTETVIQNQELLKDENTPQAAWDNYLKFIDEIVLDGLIKTVAVSYVFKLTYLPFKLFNI